MFSRKTYVDPFKKTLSFEYDKQKSSCNKLIKLGDPEKAGLFKPLNPEKAGLFKPLNPEKQGYLSH
jgi:hypothetical protein